MCVMILYVGIIRLVGWIFLFFLALGVFGIPLMKGHGMELEVKVDGLLGIF